MTTGETTTPLYELEDAAIEGPDGPMLNVGDWSIGERAITVFGGPAGPAKPTRRRALAGERASIAARAIGRWHYKQADVSRAAGQELAWVRQSKNAPVVCTVTNPEIRGRIVAALSSGAPTVLLDEPTRGLSPDDVRWLAARLREHRERGAAILITHDLAFAREIADDVCLVAAGAVQARCDAETFFERPPSDLVTRFLRQGNCWPEPETPPLPPHFHWILPDQLAGMGRPGMLGDADRDLAAIAAAGVGLLVSLTEEPFATARLRPFGIAGRHHPIPDMGVPAVGACASLCRDVARQLAAGDRVAIHCHAGLGRTGTILAAILVWMGEEPVTAIERVRAVARGYIQNRAQYDFVLRFAESVAPAR